MPNWCANRLQVIGPSETIAAIVAATKMDHGEFDFHGVAPMPKDLDITTSKWGTEILYGDWAKVLEYPTWRDRFIELTGGHLPASREEMIELIERGAPGNEFVWSFGLDEARQAKANQEKYGFKDWQEWTLANWGTQSNSNQVEIESQAPESFSVVFSTAWSPPIRLVQALCEQYPDLKIEMAYAETRSWYAGRVYGIEGCATDVPAEDVQAFCEAEFGQEFGEAENETDACAEQPA